MRDRSLLIDSLSLFDCFTKKNLFQDGANVYHNKNDSKPKDPLLSKKLELLW